LLSPHELNKPVYPTSNTRSEEWTEPIDPMIPCESDYDTGAEASGRVETTTGKEDTAKLGNE
jgi:hypothetical protein